MPMEENDTQSASKNLCEEDLFLNEVVKGEADLLYLDSYLKDILCKRG